MQPLARVKFEFVRYTRGRGLDLSTGSSVAFPHMLGVREGEVKPPFVPDRFADLATIEDASCDFICAADVLARQAHPSVVLGRWLDKVKVDGHVCVFEPQGHTKDLLRLAHGVSDRIGVEIVKCGEGPGGGAFLILRKLAEAGVVQPFPRQGKTACVVRHGGIGDQMQAAYLLPELKRQGYHVTFLTTPQGRSVIEHDPNVDEWFILDKDQVPPHEVPWFWRTIGAHYDKFVNLNESVEGTFLAPADRAAHAWPWGLRQQRMNGNYAEFAAALAEIDFVPEGRFYPSADETTWVDAYLTGLQRAFVPDWRVGMRSQPVYTILWALSGSSPHKFTPHQDTVMGMILRRLTRAVVILVGDEACKILETGWEDEPRVRCESGNLTVRQTLALAQRANLVIGPETGTLNAVCYEPDVHKVLMLSHSSRENLTKHWINTTSVEGIASCWPCHQLHVTAEFCSLDETTHAAKCQAQVHPDSLYRPIDADYTAWARVQLLRSAA